MQRVYSNRRARVVDFVYTAESVVHARELTIPLSVVSSASVFEGLGWPRG